MPVLRIKVRWLVFMSLMTIVFLSLGVMTAASVVQFKNEMIQATSENLSFSTHMIAESLRMCPANYEETDLCAKNICNLMSMGDTSSVFTTIRANGELLCDSRTDTRLPSDGYLSRPEVRGAIEHGKASAVRKSITTGEEMIYFARAAVGPSGDTIVVRFAKPMSLVLKAVHERYVSLFYGGLIALLMAVFFGLVLSDIMSRPLKRLYEGARNIASGYLSCGMEKSFIKEYNMVVDSLNTMAAELGRRIQEISREREKLEVIFSTMSEGIILLDEAGRVLTANRAALQMLGVEDLEHLLTDESVLAGVLDGLRSEQSHFEQELSMDDRTLLLHGSMVRSETEDSPRRWMIVLADVTRLKRLEEVRRRFVANVSHELKTPITVIKGYVETLMSGTVKEPKAVEKFLHSIDRQVDRMASIVEDLLILARIEQEEQEGHVESISWDICETVRLVLDDMASMARDKRITLRFDCDDSVILNANHTLMRVAIYNLLSNAIKYSPADTVVEVRVEAGSRDVSISVRDEGPGIPKEHLPHLFERFYRVDKSRSRKLGGTGLGLSIVKHIVTLHRGEVTVESEEGKGSIFTLIIPNTGTETADYGA